MSVNHQLSGGAFQKNLAFGQMAETLIARWLISRGNIVLPIYDIEYSTGKGPRVFSKSFHAAAPDLYAWKTREKDGQMERFWIEAKHKSVFTWHRKTGKWTTGIDLHHWRHYQLVSAKTLTPVWLLFLHRQSVPDPKDSRFEGCPSSCPTGLFGENIAVLASRINHDSDKHGPSGMVYWARESLKFLAPLSGVLALEKQKHGDSASA